MASTRSRCSPAQAGGAPAAAARRPAGSPARTARRPSGPGARGAAPGAWTCPADEHRLEDALGSVRPHGRRGAVLDARPPRRPRPRSGGPWRAPPRARSAARSRRRCRRRRPARRGRRQLERADRDVELEPRDRAGKADRAGVDLAAGGLQLGDHPQAWTLGAPVTEPGGNVARSSVAVADPGAGGRGRGRRGATARVGLRGGRRGATIVPYSQTRPRSLRIRSTIITCSAASLTEPRSVLERGGRHRRVGVAGDRALDRAGDDVRGPGGAGTAPATGEAIPPRGRAKAAAWGGSTCASAAANRSVARASVSPCSRRQMLAWKISPAAIRRRHCGDGVEVVRGVVRAQAQRRHPRAAERRGGRRARSRTCRSRRVERVAAVVGDERLEPPPPVGVAAQDVVVVGQVEVGQRHRPVGGAAGCARPGRPSR